MPSSSRFKAVLFDLDGTLYDYNRAETAALRELALVAGEEWGLSEQEFTDLSQRAFDVQKRRIGTKSGSIHNRLMRIQISLEMLGRMDLFPRAMYYTRRYLDKYLDSMVPSPGLFETLDGVRARGIVSCLATNFILWVQYEKASRLGITGKFDYWVTSEETGLDKPEPRFFRQCVEKVGCAPEECLFVGDSFRNDIEASIASGMEALWFAPDPEIRAKHPEARAISALPEVLDFL